MEMQDIIMGWNNGIAGSIAGHNNGNLKFVKMRVQLCICV